MPKFWLWLGVIITLLGVITQSGCKGTEEMRELVAQMEEGKPSSQCGKECVAKIQASRKNIVGIEPNELKYVNQQLKGEYSVPVWSARARSCLKHWPQFAKASELTLYPAELLAGKAFVEALGCQFIKATNGDGGVGPMQITTPDSTDIKDLGRMLGVSTADAKKRYRVNSEDGYNANVLLGAIMLSRAENTFQSRGVGMLAYNRGAGNVKKDMRRGKLSSPYLRHHLSDFRGAVPTKAGKGGRPQIYVDRILAGAVMIDRAHRGLAILTSPIRSIQEIPGYNPAQDGEKKP